MKTPRSVWWTWWLVFACLALVIAAGLALGGCGLLGFGGGGPAQPAPDPLASPFGYLFHVLRIVVQWAVILGVVMLFPRPRMILWPLISWLWRAPTAALRGDRRELAQVSKDAALAPLRLPGLVHSDEKANYARLQQKGIDGGWIDPATGTLKEVP